MAIIGLVTVLFKSDEVLEGFIRTVSAQDYRDYILYIVDNSPNEKTDEYIRQLVDKYPLPKWYHLKSNGNIGVAAGNNSGSKQALADGCDWVLLLNNDIEISDTNVLSTLVERGQKGEQILVPKILYYDSRRIWMAGGHMDRWRALGVHDGYDKDDSSKFNQPHHISYAPTCFMLISGDVFKRIGFMDERYFAYYDDTDFVWRALKAGIKIYYEPSVSILHKVSSSSANDSTFYIFYSNRNKVYFIRKNLHGIRRYFALFYTFLSRTLFYLKFNKEKRKKLVQGIREGLHMKI
jgi:GT2 family glycosyltransferase